MQTTTIKGNKSTTPRGTETAELPFNRRGRLKKAHLDDVLFLLPASFIVGRSVAVGKRFIARRTTSIAVKNEGSSISWLLYYSYVDFRTRCIIIVAFMNKLAQANELQWGSKVARVELMHETSG